MGWIEAAVVATALAVLLIAFRSGLVEAIREALDDFRGGPPRPMHPSPVNDAHLIRSRLQALRRR